MSAKSSFFIALLPDYRSTRFSHRQEADF
jgi:hypothetical protein